MNFLVFFEVFVDERVQHFSGDLWIGMLVRYLDHTALRRYIDFKVFRAGNRRNSLAAVRSSATNSRKDLCLAKQIHNSFGKVTTGQDLHFRANDRSSGVIR